MTKLLSTQDLKRAIISAVMLLMFAGSSGAEPWNLNGSWTAMNRKGHDILATNGIGSAKPLSNAPSEIATDANGFRFGLNLSEGRLDFEFRESAQGKYRLVFELQSGLNVRLEQIAPDGAITTLFDHTEAKFEKRQWHDVRLSHRISTDEGTTYFLFSGVMDGESVISVKAPDPLPVGAVGFVSYADTVASVDVVEDDLDKKADADREISRIYGKTSGRHYVSENRDTFAQAYTSMGRSNALVQMRRAQGFNYVIEETDLLKQGYVLAKAISSTPAPAQFLPADPSAPLSGLVAVPEPKRAIVFAVTPYELNALNNPTESRFSIYGKDLGVDQAWVYLGRPFEEYTSVARFNVVTLQGAKARGAPGNTDGLEIVQRIDVDLKKLSPGGDPRALPIEGDVGIWVKPDYASPNFSNRSQIFLKSRWKSAPMLVGHARRFRIHSDGTDWKDGIPEQYWAFGGYTIDKTTSDPAMAIGRQTLLSFPYRMSAPWSADRHDWTVGIPIFAAETKDISKVLRLGVTGFESDKGGAGAIVVKVMDAIGKIMSKAKFGESTGKTILSVAGEILQGAAEELREDDDEMLGAYEAPFLAPDFGQYDQPHLSRLTVDGETKVETEVAVKRVDAPFLKSVNVRVTKFRWTAEPANSSPSPLSGDNDLVLVARAATGFAADGQLATGQDTGIFTEEFERLENEWVELSGKGQLILSRSFSRPVLAPFLYLEFALWDIDELSDDDNFGGPFTRLHFFGDAEMTPYSPVVKGSGKVRLPSVGFSSAAEILYEFEVEKWTGPLP